MGEGVKIKAISSVGISAGVNGNEGRSIFASTGEAVACSGGVGVNVLIKAAVTVGDGVRVGGKGDGVFVSTYDVFGIFVRLMTTAVDATVGALPSTGWHEIIKAIVNNKQRRKMFISGVTWSERPSHELKGNHIWLN